ncbi:MAG: MFS transporter [Stackebrandtia sp.]
MTDLRDDPSPTLPRRRSLWTYRGVRPLIGATAISNVGTEISGVAIPIMAIVVLQASNTWVAMLEVALYVGMLLFTLPIGLVADRFDRKKLMIGADLFCMAAVASAPILWAVGHLTIALLLLVVVAVGVFSTVHDVCSETVVPDVVDDDALATCNGAINTSRSVSEVAGPGAGGLIVSGVGAVAGLVVDAVSFLVSALLLTRVPVKTRPRAPAPRPTVRQTCRDVADGFGVYRSDRRLLRLLAVSTTSNFFSTMAGTVEVLFLVRELHVRPWGVGAAFALTAVGGVVGGLLLSPLLRLVGPVRIIVVSQLALSAPILLLPLATEGWGVSFYLIGWFFYSLSSVIYVSAVVTYRQRTAPRELLGRAGATSRWFGGIAAALGAVAAAGMLSVWDISTAVLISSVGIYASGVWLCSRVFFSDSALHTSTN